MGSVGCFTPGVCGCLSLHNAVAQIVSTPLGLVSTGFHATNSVRLATAYADDTPRPRRMREPDTIAVYPGTAGLLMDPRRALMKDMFPSGGAGMVGSAGDAMTLLEALRSGDQPIMSPLLVEDMSTDQILSLQIHDLPGLGFGLGFSVLRDPSAAGVAESIGTLRWGGAYGHSWFVDPVKRLTVVAFTNTALEGMSNGGRFPADLSRAVYNALE